jgi:ribonuclease Z
MANLSRMRNTLIGYSKALYASWFYYRPARLLLDGGEGIIHSLGKKVFGIRKIFLTHGHEDHIAGLPSLVNLRNLSNGDREIPLEIHYPAGDPFIEYLIDYLDKKQRHRLKYKLTWHEMTGEEPVDLTITKRPTRVAPFPVSHTRNCRSLGYRIEEKRQVLKPEFAGAGPDEVKNMIIQDGREAVLTTVWHPLLAYTGDCRPLQDVTCCRGSDILLIDSTYTSGEDTVGSNHSHIESSFAVAAEAGVKHLVLMHLSGRYTKYEILDAIDRAAKKHGWPPRMGYFYEGRYLERSGSDS